MERDFFDLGRNIIEGVVKGSTFLEILLTASIIIGGAALKKLVEYYSERNKPVAITIVIGLCLIVTYFIISGVTSNKETAPTTDEQPMKVAGDSENKQTETPSDPDEQSKIVVDSSQAGQVEP